MFLADREAALAAVAGRALRAVMRKAVAGFSLSRALLTQEVVTRTPLAEFMWSVT